MENQAEEMISDSEERLAKPDDEAQSDRRPAYLVLAPDRTEHGDRVESLLTKLGFQIKRVIGSGAGAGWENLYDAWKRIFKDEVDKMTRGGSPESWVHIFEDDATLIFGLDIGNARDAIDIGLALPTSREKGYVNYGMCDPHMRPSIRYTLKNNMTIETGIGKAVCTHAVALNGHMIKKLYDSFMNKTDKKAKVDVLFNEVWYAVDRTVAPSIIKEKKAKCAYKPGMTP
mmetsp:Transcript_6883/g.20940  ORF Transcript_6883/g.20940 Transcript_6883/m.20940 type:complete len:229 (+) Transcript_6883:789-1475(+)